MEGFVTVCKVDELQNGDVKQFELDNGYTILLYRDNQNFYATSSTCTHYGASLIKGSVKGCRIRCPLHGACFDLKTGDIEEFPAWKKLQKFNVVLDNNEVKVSREPVAEKECGDVTQSEQNVLIIGGGAAGFTCASTLRGNGFDGKITIISKESLLPYYRVKLSKQPAMDPAKITLKPMDYFQKNSINIELNCSVNRVFFSERFVELTDGRKIGYSHLVIAAGSIPNKPTAAKGIRGIHYLRTSEDGKQFAEEAIGKRLVVLGSGYIGFEIAAAFSKQSTQVTVLSNSKFPLEKLVGASVGEALLELHNKAGVQFVSYYGEVEFKSSGGNLSAVRVNSTDYEADCCIIAKGVKPNTSFLQDSGLEMNNGGFIFVDEFMKTSIEGVFAAGDVANFPLPLNVTGGKRMRQSIGHWPIAQMTGKIAALNIMKKNIPFSAVPFFWTTMYGTNLRYCGFNTTGSTKNVIIHGDITKHKFVAYFLDDSEEGRVMSVATMGMDPLASHFGELVHSGGNLFRKDIAEDSDGTWTKSLTP